MAKRAKDIQTVAFVSLGCPKNLVDSERMLGLLAEDRHANHRGTVQGGLLSTFADFVLGRAIDADAEDEDDKPAGKEAEAKTPKKPKTAKAKGTKGA